MSDIGLAYGQALYGLARDESLSEPIFRQLQALQESFQAEPDFLRLLGLPDIPIQERCKILDGCFADKLHPYVLNFLKLLTEKRLARYFPDCVRTYREQFEVDHNILPVTAVTAVPLSADQVARLAEKLSRDTGKTAQVENRVDPSCLGGVRLDYDGKRVDGSVANRMESVRRLLKNTVL